MSDLPNDGGPAFPLAATSGSFNCHGMCLRDWFAGQALTGSLADPNVNGSSLGELSHAVAQGAYTFADAMLAARQNGGAK